MIQVQVLVGQVQVLKIWTGVGLVYIHTVGLEYYITETIKCTDIPPRESWSKQEINSHKIFPIK